MIISCHLPKTAGTSFGHVLSGYFQERLFLDYGDRVGWNGPEAEAWRRGREIPEKVLSGAIDVVHGHFYLEKYLEVFPDAAIVTFVREPVDRVVSNYKFLAANPQIKHPLVEEFHRKSPTLQEWIRWPWARNLQSRILGDKGIENMKLVGLTERYHESLERFDTIFKTDLARRDDGDHHNRSESTLAVPNDVRAEIAELNRADTRLYAKACRIFESMEQR